MSFAMWFPADTPAFDGMALIREEQPPQFTPRPMPSRIELYPVKKESGLLSRLKGMFKKSKEDSVTAIADTKIDTSASKTADTKTDTNASKVAAVQAKPNTFNQDKAQPIQKTEKSAPQVSCPVSQPLEVSPDDERLMLSQLVALFHKTGHDGYRNRYINELQYEIALPRMQLYVDYAADIYELYLNYFAPEDIHVYSIDESFIDATEYLKMYRTDGLHPYRRNMHRLWHIAEFSFHASVLCSREEQFPLEKTQSGPLEDRCRHIGLFPDQKLQTYLHHPRVFFPLQDGSFCHTEMPPVVYGTISPAAMPRLLQMLY